MNDFSVIETGGKQYKVSVGSKIKIDKPGAVEGARVIFDKVLLKSGGGVRIGAPYLSGEKAEGKVFRLGHERTKIVFKYHPKTRYRKKKGHRQRFAEVQIEKI